MNNDDEWKRFWRRIEGISSGRPTGKRATAKVRMKAMMRRKYQQCRKMGCPHLLAIHLTITEIQMQLFERMLDILNNEVTNG